MALFAMVMPIGYISHHQRHYKYFEDNVLRPIQQQIYEWGHLNIIEVQTWAYPQHLILYANKKSNRDVSDIQLDK